MKTLNLASTAQLLSASASTMVLCVTTDPMAATSSYGDIRDCLGVDGINELRYSGSLVLVADSLVLDDRDALRTAMATLSIVLPEESGLHGEAILFDSGTLVDRANGEAVEPSEIG